MYVGRMLTPDEFWARMRANDDALRARFATWPTYALADWTGARMIDEWSLGDGTFRSVRFDSADDLQIVVATSDDLDSEPARHLLLNLPTADTERLRDEEKSRAHYERSEREANGTVLISVSGIPVRFVTWTEDGYTVAGASHDAVGIAVRTNGPIEGMSLARVDDIEPYIDGRNDRIRALRAERGLDD
jgi:hypothetical protein